MKSIPMNFWRNIFLVIDILCNERFTDFEIHDNILKQAFKLQVSGIFETPQRFKLELILWHLF